MDEKTEVKNETTVQTQPNVSQQNINGQQQNQPNVNQIQYGQQPASNLKINGVGLASFICAIVGIFTLQFPCGVAAVVTGIIGIVKFNKETEKGKWMAITGVSLGAVEILITIIAFIIVFVVGTSSYYRY